ncbi:MAG: MMPL family transporter [Planctomycetia bacterium]|nr:MMPL family transporter [Planctomycetia bacterium]
MSDSTNSNIYQSHMKTQGRTDLPAVVSATQNDGKTDFYSASGIKGSKDHSMLSAPLGGLIRCVLRYPYVMLFLMIGLAVGAGLYTQENLKFKNRRLDLINPKSEWNQYWLEYIAKFGSEDDLIIVVEGETPEKIITAVNETAEKIEAKQDLFHSLFYKFDDTALLSKALYFASDEELEDLNLFLKSHAEVFQGKWDTVAIDHILPQTVMPLTAAQEHIPPRMVSNLRQALDRMILSLESALGKEYQFVSPFPEIDITKGRQTDRMPTVNAPSTSDMSTSQGVSGVSMHGMSGMPGTSGTSGMPGIQSMQNMRDMQGMHGWDALQQYQSTQNIQNTQNTRTYQNHEDYQSYQNNEVSYRENYPTSAFRLDAHATPFPGMDSSRQNLYVANYPNSGNSGMAGSPVRMNPYDNVQGIQGLPAPDTGGLVVAPVNPYYAANVTDMEISAVQENSGVSQNEQYTQNVTRIQNVTPVTYHEQITRTVTGNKSGNMAGPVSSPFDVQNSTQNTVSDGSQNVPVVQNVPVTQEAVTGNVSENATVGELLQNGGEAHSENPAPDMTAILGQDAHIHYTWLTPNKTAVMMVKMVEEENEEFARGTAGIDAIRGIIHDVQEGNPGVKVSLTGLPVMENDEMRSSQDSMGIATWLSIAGVALLYIFFFRELRHPILAIFALFIGIGWSVAYIMLFIGHLNILSISFAVILVGLGIDFSIHYTSRYLQCRNEGDDTFNALVRAATEIGPGILTGALTTAAAFYMAGLTEFTGIAELGIIAGGGVLCCCMAALTALPVMIYLSDRNRPMSKIPKPRDPVFFHVPPKVVFALSMIAVIAAACGLPKLYYDYNLLNLQPEGLESVEVEMRLINESKQSVWYALSMSDDEEVLRKRIAEFSALPSVERVEQLVTLIPAAENPLVRRIHEVLTKTPTGVNQRPYLTKEDAKKLYQCLEMARRCFAGKEEFTGYLARIEALQKQLLGMKLTDYFDRMTQYQEALALDLLAKLNTLEKISSPEPPSLNDLPQPYVDRMYAKDGTFLLKIYGKGDLWDMDNLETFVREVRSVDPKATGNPLQTYECSLQMKKGYQDAAVYALIMVVALLLLDLRSICDTFLALFPVQLGLLSMFGIMGFLGIPLNAANLIVLPLVLGIGIDDGVHIIHDFRKFYQGKGVYRITPSTSMSVILTSLTTILSFGTLMLAQHRGLQSLGLVLVIGTTCCWLSSLLILPAILNLFFSKKRQIPQSADPVAPTDCDLYPDFGNRGGFSQDSYSVSQQNSYSASRQDSYSDSRQNFRQEMNPNSYQGLRPHLATDLGSDTELGIDSGTVLETASVSLSETVSEVISHPGHQEVSHEISHEIIRETGRENYREISREVIPMNSVLEADYENYGGRCATCYTRNENGEIINSQGRAA